MPALDNAPTKDPITEESRFVTFGWVEWIQDLIDALNKSPKRLFNAVSLEDQSASIAAADLTDGSISAGLYRVTYYARITQAATTSSSLTVTVGWTDGGVTPSQSGAAMTGNTTTTVQSGTLMIRADEGSAINYSTTYASVGATAAEYSLSVYLEEVPE